MAVNYPYIPDVITVHLGKPDSDAPNITVPFVDYIKNVASSEIYPTWSEEALRANIYAITTFALNRIYTEWYRSRGYDFDITNSTQYDQAFVRDRDIFENISNLVDELFNDYVTRQGSIEPYFTQFCNGTTVTCDGLSQWGTEELAQQGMTPYEILQHYYGDDINIVRNAPVQQPGESFSGIVLKQGTGGNAVLEVQRELNRIAKNYPAIPQINDPDGYFGPETDAAVRKFQEVFDLPVTGEVDKATWYKIKRYYYAVKRIGELVSEGISMEEAAAPFSEGIREGDKGDDVRILQYYLNVIAYFNPDLNIVPLDGDFGPATKNAVQQFQRAYGLTPDGIVGADTWNKLTSVYADTVGNFEAGYTGQKARIYPGYFLTRGSRGRDVSDLQLYLTRVAQEYQQLNAIPVTGYYGEQTENAVKKFQRLFGIPDNGVTGPLTWLAITSEYNRANGNID